MTFPAGKQQEEASREQADTSSNERPNDIEENKDVNTTKNRQVTASVLLQTGGGTIVDPKLALSNDTLKQQQSAPENADDGNNNNGKLTLEHMKKLLRTSKRFEHVTEEHIERVRMIHDRFVQKASLSFNYNTLLFVASVLAGLGLASDSTSTIIASVLVR
jgi:response regulator RpfG family c-di-GMP phosphodiesterase